MYCEAIVAYGEPLQRLENPTPAPAGSEVIVEITECGVCHSDLSAELPSSLTFSSEIPSLPPRIEECIFSS